MRLETLLLSAAQSPIHRWTIITLSFAIGVAIVVPGADEYAKVRQRCARFEARVARTSQELASLDGVRRQADQQKARLREWEARMVPADRVHLFRQEVVEMARKQGCQVRRIRVELPRSRAWEKGDDPMRPVVTTRRKTESPLIVNLQPVSLAVSGPLQGVKNMLSELQAQKRLMRTNSLSLHPEQDDRKQVVLECELLLVSLSQSPATMADAARDASLRTSWHGPGQLAASR